ncbi:acetyl-CoA acetyltransferase [Thermodesulfobacteriota bacterium]
MTKNNMPIIVGIGEICEPVPENLKDAHSIVDLGALAAEKACNDISSELFSAKDIDAIAATRPFSEYVERYSHPFGITQNLPRAIGSRLNCEPAYALYSKPRGASPQMLINEFCGRIASGEFETVLIVGGEVIANIKAAKRAGISLDWTEDTGGQLEDRGYTEEGYYTSQEHENDLMLAISLYGMMENARRYNLKLTRREYARKTGELFHPFSRVAAHHDSSMFQKEYSVDEIAFPSEKNPQLNDPYTKAMVAKDRVNQAGAIILTSEKKARELAIDPSRLIYLHSHCTLRERVLLERKDPAKSPAMALAYQSALARAGIGQEDIRFFDIYSCFPVAVFNACETLGLDPDDSRGLTVTGGLPFFGGAGNSYSLFGVSGIVRALRKNPAAYGLVGSNGGAMSIHAVGIYSGNRPEGGWKNFNDTDLQIQLDAEPAPRIDDDPMGEAEIITYTVTLNKGRPARGFIMGRLIESGAVFLGATDPEDFDTPAKMLEIEPIGKKVFVSSAGPGNRFRFKKNG